jgi:hypothetical protein
MTFQIITRLNCMDHFFLTIGRLDHSFIERA